MNYYRTIYFFTLFINVYSNFLRHYKVQIEYNNITFWVGLRYCVRYLEEKVENYSLLMFSLPEMRKMRDFIYQGKVGCLQGYTYYSPSNPALQ